MTLAKLAVILQLDSRLFQAGMVSAIGQVQALQRSVMGLGAGQALSSIGRGLTYGLTIPLIALGAAIGSVGGGLDEQLARVQSVIATPKNSGIEQIMAWRPQIQRLGVDMGRSSEEVAAGMYEIVSAIGPVSNAMEYLTITSRGAVAGQSDIVTSTKNMVLATRAWGDNSTAMVQTMTDLASQTVKVGTLTESELGPALAKMLPISKAYGVTLNDSFASLSALSGVTGNASEVATQFTRAVLSLVAPNTKLTAAYKAMGVESGALLIQQEGLQGALQKVADYSELTGVPLLKLLGRSEALKFAIGILGEQFETFAKQSDALAGATGAVDTAFEATTGGVNAAAFQWAQAGQRLRVIAEDLYQAFAPVSLKVLDALSPIYNGLRDLADQIGAMPTEQLTQITYGLLGLMALGPVLSIVGGLTTFFSGLVTVLMAVNPWVWAVAAAGGALWMAWNNDWGGIQGGVASLMDTIKRRADATRLAIENLQKTWDLFTTPKTNDGEGMTKTLRDVGKAIADVWRSLGPAKSELSHFEKQMIESAPKMTTVWDTFVSGMTENWPDFSQMGRDIQSMFNAIGQAIGTAMSNIRTSIQSGWMLTVGSTAASLAQFVGAVKTGIGNAIAAAKTGVSNIRSAFTGAGWFAVGSSIISGIVSGIRSGVGNLASAAASAAKSALAAAKSALGIKSPSAVFRDQVGRMIPAGVALGIYDGASLVNRAVSALALGGTSGGYSVGVSGGFALAGAGGGSTTTTETTINVYVTAGPGATEQDGQAVGVGISDALRGAR